LFWNNLVIGLLPDLAPLLRGDASGPAFGRRGLRRRLTSHQTVIRRALAGVETVDQRIADLQKNGGMKDINAEVKAARKVRTVVRYHDFLHTKKLAMLEAIARRL
jgi:hypothetical protein